MQKGKNLFWNMSEKSFRKFSLDFSTWPPEKEEASYAKKIFFLNGKIIKLFFNIERKASRWLPQSPHEISLIFQNKLRVMFLNDKVNECNQFWEGRKIAIWIFGYVLERTADLHQHEFVINSNEIRANIWWRWLGSNVNKY
jgi:hypothetical protein